MQSPDKYQLQACLNLEQEMLARGWPADAAYFRTRAQAVRRKMNKEGRKA